MKEYRDPVSNLFCVTFDNSSVMGQFYEDIKVLGTSSIASIFSSYVDNNIKLHYYTPGQGTTVYANPASYVNGDFLMASINKGTTFVFDKKFFMYNRGAFGECVKNNPIQFMVPTDKITCGFKLKPFNTCAQNSWDKMMSYNLTIASTPSATSYLPLTLNNVYYKDHKTGLLSQSSTGTPPATSFTNVNGTYCQCDNVLEEADFNFIVSNTTKTITNVYVDLILGKNVVSQCTSNYIISQTYSTSFLTDLKYNYVRSGNPGYESGANLLIAFNETTSSGTSFTLQKDGFYTVGRGQDSSCVALAANKNYEMQSDFDEPIKYGQSSIYSCIQSLTLTDFESFCSGKKWKQLVMYNFPNLIEYIGTFGNSNYQYIKDWTSVIDDYDIDNSTWYGTNNTNTCYMPGQIFLDILTSQAGAVTNPQEYVVAARLSARYYNITHMVPLDQALVAQTFTLSFITNFVPLTVNMFTQTRDNPSIIPGIPKDIAAPLIQGS